MSEITGTQKIRVLRILDQAGTELGQRQLDQFRRLGGEMARPRDCLLTLFDGGRFDGEQEIKPSAEEPPAELFKVSGTTLIQAQEDPGIFPSDLPVWAYQLVATARYELEVDDGELVRWTIRAGFYRYTGAL